MGSVMRDWLKYIWLDWIIGPITGELLPQEKQWLRMYKHMRSPADLRSPVHPVECNCPSCGWHICHSGICGNLDCPEGR